LSVALGYDPDAQWYLEAWKLEALYDTLEAKARTLLTELDEATDQYKRKEWLEKTVAVVTPPTNRAEKDHTIAASPSSVSAVTASPEPAGVTTAAAAKPSPFGKKKAEADSASPSSLSAEAASPGAAGVTTTPAAKPSPFAKKKAEAEAAHIDAMVQAAVAELKPEHLTSLSTEMGITEEQLQELLENLPDDFEKMVADQVRALS
jgi:hypothetical protein